MRPKVVLSHGLQDTKWFLILTIGFYVIFYFVNGGFITGNFTVFAALRSPFRFCGCVLFGQNIMKTYQSSTNSEKKSCADDKQGKMSDEN